MRIFLTGSTGFIGSRLCRELLRRGDQVVALTRDPRRLGSAAQSADQRLQVEAGDPAQPGPWQSRLRGCDAVIALAGEPVMGKRWSADFKRRVLDSRVEGMNRLGEAIAALSEVERPRTVITASAIGYYGDRGAAVCTEDTPPGDDFLAEVCVAWEDAARKLGALGPRVASLRIGVVLGEGGGALSKMLPAFRAFVGGPLGSGDQYLSWIHLMDVVGLLLFLLDSEDPRARGPVNGTAPEPATMAEFSRVLASILHRPAAFRVPAFALKALLGEAAAVLTGSQRVLPERARALGYRFRYPHLEEALRAAIYP